MEYDEMKAIAESMLWDVITDIKEFAENEMKNIPGSGEHFIQYEDVVDICFGEANDRGHRDIYVYPLIIDEFGNITGTDTGTGFKLF